MTSVSPDNLQALADRIKVEHAYQDDMMLRALCPELTARYVGQAVTR